MNNIKITVNPKTEKGGAIGFRNVRIRDKILTKLFGEEKQLFLVIPGSEVNTLHIKEEFEGGDEDASV